MSGTLWEIGAFRLSAKEREAAGPFRDWLRDSGTRLGSYLADVRADGSRTRFGRNEVIQLEKQIWRSCAKKAEAHQALEILGKVIYYLNRRLQSPIPQPRLVLSKEPETNPMVEETPRAHRSVAAWMEAEETWVARLSPWDQGGAYDAYNLPVELVVFSATLHCGILDVDSAVAIYDALRNPGGSFRCSRDRVYTDLPLPWQGMADQDVRRWYADERLTCLIARISSDFVRPPAELFELDALGDSILARRRKISERIHRGIVAELKRQELDAQLLPGSLREMFDLIGKVLHSDIPSILVTYGMRKADTRSQLPESIGRIYGDPALPKIEPEVAIQTESEEAAQDNSEAYDEDVPSGIEAEWVAPTRFAFRSRDKNTVERELRELLQREGDEPTPQQRVWSFALHLLRNGASSGAILKISSVKCCVLTVARRLGGSVGLNDPAGFSAVTLESKYLEILDAVPNGSRDPRRLVRTVTWALREFQRFLVANCQAAPVNEAVAFPAVRGLLPVDSRIISVDDVFNAVRYIAMEPGLTRDPLNRSVAQREVILGFFGGLRRDEGLGLSAIDFLGGRLAAVLIRPSDGRNLKTPNATRASLLSPLIYPFSDLQKIANSMRLQGDAGHESQESPLLFGGASDDVIIPIIHRALQEVTGDRTMHFHVLRHSFATWTFLRLMLADLPEIPDLFPHLPKTTEWLRTSRVFRRLLYGNELVSNDHAWAGATLLGHSSPPVSLENYIHCMDLLLPLFLKQGSSLGNIPDELLRRFSGLKKSTAYSWFPRRQNSGQLMHSDSSQVNSETERILAPEEEKTEHQTSSVLQSSESRTPVGFAKSVFRRRFGTEVAPSGDCDIQPRPTRTWIQATWNLIYMSATSGQPVYELAPYFDLELETAEHILGRAADLAEVRCADGAHFLHPMVEREDGEKGAGLTKRLCYPARPRSVKARAIIQEFAACLEHYADADPESARLVFKHYARNVPPKSLRLLFQGIFERDVVIGYSDLFDHLRIRRGSFRWYMGKSKKPLRSIRSWLRNAEQPGQGSSPDEAGGSQKPASSGESLAVELTFEDIPDSKGSRTDYVQAFRFAMLMAAIRFG